MMKLEEDASQDLIKAAIDKLQKDIDHLAEQVEMMRAFLAI